MYYKYFFKCFWVSLPITIYVCHNLLITLGRLCSKILIGRESVRWHSGGGVKLKFCRICSTVGCALAEWLPPRRLGFDSQARILRTFIPGL